ncbi:MAG: hypothetical protein ACREBU_26255 [Nitrososphaera sp.]
MFESVARHLSMTAAAEELPREPTRHFPAA